MKKPTAQIKTYSLPFDVLAKLEDLYFDHAIKKEKSSRSSIVAQAITELWERDHEKSG